MLLKRWRPIIHYKLIYDLPLGISISIRGQRERTVMGGDDKQPTRCVCCGGHIVSNVVGPVFEWACTPGREELGCKYHYDLLEVPCPPDECPLQSDPRIKKQRRLYQWYIRKEILAILRRHGYCVTKGPHDEIVSSLKKWQEKKLIEVYVYDLLWIIYPTKNK